MKRKLTKVFAVLAVSAFAASCSITVPVTASSASMSKKGTSETTVFLGLYLNNSYGVKEAAKKGGITGAIATVDEKTTNFLIMQKKELIVTGE